MTTEQDPVVEQRAPSDGIRQAQSPTPHEPMVEQRALRARRDPGDGFPQAQSPEPQTQPPMLTVVKGQPTAEELAAVTAVVLALQGGTEQESAKPATRSWARRAQLNLPPRPGAGAWRRSGR